MRIRFTCSPHLFFHLAISESPIFWNGLWKSTFIGISLRKYVWKKREVKTSTKIDMKSFGIAWSDRAVFCSRYFYSFSRFLFRSNYIVQPSSHSSINRQKKEQADEWPHKTHLLDPAIYWTNKIFSNDSWACARASQYRAVIFFSMNETRQNLSLNVNGLIQSRRKEWMNLLFGVATHWDCALNAEAVQWTIILRSYIHQMLVPCVRSDINFQPSSFQFLKRANSQWHLIRKIKTCISFSGRKD